jgi:hypothetical protein
MIFFGVCDEKISEARSSMGLLLRFYLTQNRDRAYVLAVYNVEAVCWGSSLEFLMSMGEIHHDL